MNAIEHSKTPVKTVMHSIESFNSIFILKKNIFPFIFLSTYFLVDAYNINLFFKFVRLHEEFKCSKRMITQKKEHSFILKYPTSFNPAISFI